MKLLLYRALIRAKLDYGSIIYSAACKSYLKRPQPIQNEGLCLNAFHASLMQSPHVEAIKFPLHPRWGKLSPQYMLKIQNEPNNPTYKKNIHVTI